jgi:hypothetical protein
MPSIQRSKAMAPACSMMATPTTTQPADRSMASDRMPRLDHARAEGPPRKTAYPLACLGCLLALVAGAACGQQKSTEPAQEASAPRLEPGPNRTEPGAKADDSAAERNGATATASPPASLRACPTDELRQARCGVPRAEAAGCPALSTDLEVLVTPLSFEPDPRAEELDPWLAGAYSASPDRTCCYSSCVPVDVRPRAVSTHPYRSLQCLPAMTTSQPAQGHPRCPAAIRFPDDYFHHVAGFDAEGTLARTKEHASVPQLAGIEWCCYGRAPMAAIGPM